MIDINSLIDWVEFEPIYESNGIGGYEFWGFKGYDYGHKYIDRFEWDELKWSHEENEAIRKYVDENFDELVKLYS